MAGIERYRHRAYFLLIFWAVIIKMSQGRDLIVSLFEPGGLYGGKRIFFTTLAVISYSVSMWIIPAFMFQQREKNSKETNQPQLPFSEHLFFIHRVLPLVPLWLLASGLFRNDVYIFVSAAFAELILLYIFNHKVKSVFIRHWVMASLGIILIALTVYFFFYFQDLYTQMKVIYAVNLYLLSSLLFLIYHEVDNRILEEHDAADKPGQSVYRKYKINTITYFVCAVLHIIIVAIIYWIPFSIRIAPESMLLYMFSVYVFALDLLFYFINISRRRQLIALFCVIILGGLLISPLWNVNVSHHTIDANADPTILTGSNKRDSFDDRYADLKKKILAYIDSVDTPYPIVLVSGEGGGSRAGMWFSQNLINFDYETDGKFRNYIFSLSTVSGSSVGLSTLFTFWDYTRDADSIDPKWLKLPAEVYANNYVGSSIRGLLLTDLYKSFIPANWVYDRNSTLQNEEARTTARSVLRILGDSTYGDGIDIPDSLIRLKKDLMYYFYELKNGRPSYRKNMPITLINTCRSNDGRRGIFSSIRLSNSYFNEAIDINGYLYEDSISSDDGVKLCSGIRKSISLIQACNTSELFPILSAPAYIDSLGSFVDGGYHENSGLKSTLDVYQQLRIRLQNDADLAGRKYKIYIMYLKNGSGEKKLYQRVKSEPTLLQPVTTLFNQPFEGSASYFEEKAKYVDASDPYVTFLSINLDPSSIINPQKSGITYTARTTEKNEAREKEILKDLIGEIVTHEDGSRDTILNFPLARWLSKTVIKRIQLKAIPTNLSKQTTDLLQQIKTANKIKRSPYMAYYDLLNK